MELVTVAVVTALVEGAKQTGLPSRFAFIASLILGIGLSILVAATSSDLSWSTAVEGLLVGLGASGFYSGVAKGQLAKAGI